MTDGRLPGTLLERARELARIAGGDVIADAIEKVGKDGVVNVEEGQTFDRCGRRDRHNVACVRRDCGSNSGRPAVGRAGLRVLRGRGQMPVTAAVIGRVAAAAASRVGFMPDTTLLHLITGHTVRTTSALQAVLDALKPTALPDYGLARLEDAHGHVVYVRPEHVSLIESE